MQDLATNLKCFNFILLKFDNIKVIKEVDSILLFYKDFKLSIKP